MLLQSDSLGFKDHINRDSYGNILTVLLLTAASSEWIKHTLLCCVDHCMAPVKVGPCRGSFPRWHYNAASQNCEQFIFGGCRENLNNYLSKDECTNACSGSGMCSVSLSYADFLSFFPFLCHVWMYI